MKKTFRFAFNPLVWILLIAVLLVALGGVWLNVYNIIVMPPLSSAFLYVCYGVLCLVLAVFVLSVTFNSGYKIKKGKLYLNFGFIKTTFVLDKALNITYFENKNMLVLFFEGGEYTRIVIKKEKFSSFADKLREENANILYTVHKDKEE